MQNLELINLKCVTVTHNPFLCPLIKEMISPFLSEDRPTAHIIISIHKPIHILSHFHHIQTPQSHNQQHQQPQPNFPQQKSPPSQPKTQLNLSQRHSSHDNQPNSPSSLPLHHQASPFCHLVGRRSWTLGVEGTSMWTTTMAGPSGIHPL